MKKIIGKPVLFCVGSPFQCICALCAIKEFGLDDYTFFIPQNDPSNTDKIRMLLENEGILYQYHEDVGIFDLWKYLFQKGRYVQAFIGDYYNNGWGKNNAVAFLKRGSKIYYLDDGASTLSVFTPGDYREKEKGLKALMARGFRSLVRTMKLIDEKNFYTIFDVKSKKINIVKNNIDSLFKTNSPLTRDCVIIGTNPSVLPFADGKTYKDYLESTIFYIKQNYPTNRILYCPHRGDKTQSDYTDLLKANNIEFFDTQVSVEYDFYNKEIAPSLVIGFSSTALYTLKYIYTNAEVYNVYFKLSDKKMDQEHDVLRNHYKKSGIETLHLL